MNLVDVGIVVFVLALAAVGLRARPGGAAPCRSPDSSAAPRSAPGSARRCCPTGRSRATRRWSRCSPGSCSAPSSPSRSTASAGASRAGSASSAVGVADGIGGALLLAALALLRRLGLRRRRAARERRPGARPAPRGPAVGDPRRRSTTPCRPRGRCSTCCAGSTRPPFVRGPDADVRRSRRRLAPTTPTCATRRRLDRAGARHRLRARRRGLGLGRRARDSWSPTPTWSPAQDDTTVSVDGGAELDATAVHYDPRNDLAVLEVPGLDAAAAGARVERPRRGTDGAVIGYPGERPADVHPGAPRAHRARSPARTPTAAGRSQRQMTPFRGRRAQRQLGRPGRRPRRRRADDRVRGLDRRAGPRTGSGSRTDRRRGARR